MQAFITQQLIIKLLAQLLHCLSLAMPYHLLQQLKCLQHGAMPLSFNPFFTKLSLFKAVNFTIILIYDKYKEKSVILQAIGIISIKSRETRVV